MMIVTMMMMMKRALTVATIDILMTMISLTMMMMTMNGLILMTMTRTRQQVGRQLTQERVAAPSPPTCEQSPVTRYLKHKSKKQKKKSRVYRITHTIYVKGKV